MHDGENIIFVERDKINNSLPVNHTFAPMNYWDLDKKHWTQKFYLHEWQIYKLSRALDKIRLWLLTII